MAQDRAEIGAAPGAVAGCPDCSIIVDELTLLLDERGRLTSTTRRMRVRGRLDCETCGGVPPADRGGS